MQVKITIDCDNGAFDGEDCGPEVARVLRYFARRVEAGPVYLPDDMTARDSNGNTVATFTVED